MPRSVSSTAGRRRANEAQRVQGKRSTARSGLEEPRAAPAPGAGRPPSEPGSRLALQWSDFEKVDIRVGVITDVRQFPEARRPAYRLWVDFGPLGVKRASAQITRYYQAEELIGRHVVAVVNFPPKQVGPFVSEVLVLGAYDAEGGVVLLAPERPIAPGSRIG
jgi:tRNA-binding protein